MAPAAAAEWLARGPVKSPQATAPDESSLLPSTHCRAALRGADPNAAPGRDPAQKAVNSDLCYEEMFPGRLRYELNEMMMIISYL